MIARVRFARPLVETLMHDGAYTSVASLNDSPSLPMDGYHIALFLHILTLVVAGAATAVTKLAAGRSARARTVGELLDWHTVLMSGARAFPICLVSFVITGAYMLSVTHAGLWSTGFVAAGLTGVVLLLASGTYLGTKAKALKAVLEQIAATNGADHAAPKLAPPRLVAVLPVVNMFIALAVMFDMVTKPSSVPVALGVVALGIALGLALAIRSAAPVPQSAPAAN